MNDNSTNEDGPLDLSKPLLKSSPRRAAARALLPCPVCGKAFDRPSLLKRHMRTHTGEKPHVCAVCSKGFSTSSSLNTHRRIHSGEKPHQCTVCGKCFTASSNLYYHRMTHSKEKPHKCSQCTKTFPTPGDLKAHTYIHSGSWPYRCHLCSRGFSKQTNLRNHVFLHTGERPHSCVWCGKKFALACNLRAHMRTHHPFNELKDEPPLIRVPINTYYNSRDSTRSVDKLSSPDPSFHQCSQTCGRSRQEDDNTISNESAKSTLWTNHYESKSVKLEEKNPRHLCSFTPAADIGMLEEMWIRYSNTAVQQLATYSLSPVPLSFLSFPSLFLTHSSLFRPLSPSDMSTK